MEILDKMDGGGKFIFGSGGVAKSIIYVPTVESRKRVRELGKNLFFKKTHE